MQTVAPRSNSACAKSDGRAAAAGSEPSEAAAPAIVVREPGSGASIANTRAETRSTLPSTGTPGTPNAMAAMAVAVYGPMPGSACRLATSRGKPPDADTSFEQACMLRARA